MSIVERRLHDLKEMWVLNISSHDAGSIQCRPSMASDMVCHVKPGPVGRS